MNTIFSACDVYKERPFRFIAWDAVFHGIVVVLAGWVSATVSEYPDDAEAYPKYCPWVYLYIRMFEFIECGRRGAPPLAGCGKGDRCGVSNSCKRLAKSGDVVE